MKVLCPELKYHTLSMINAHIKKAKNAINHNTGPPAVIKSFRDANDSDMA